MQELYTILYSWPVIKWCKRLKTPAVHLYKTTQNILSQVGVRGARGSCNDEELIPAVKWSIGRYVCLPHRKSLTHSLLLSPGRRKHLIYSDFKHTFFFPLPYNFASQEVMSFPLNPNQTGFDGITMSHMSRRCSAETAVHVVLAIITGKNSDVFLFESSLNSCVVLFCWLTVKCVTGCIARALA